MAIVNRKQPKPTPVTPPTPVYDGLSHAVVDTTLTNQQMAQVFIEGQLWIVEYYKQLIGRDESLYGLDTGLDPVLQQLECIKGMQLRVQSPLTRSFNSENAVETIQGESTLYPGIIPNRGDTFLADIGNGQVGIFSITEAEPLSYLKETCYRITYQLIGYDQEQYLADLTQKTVKTVHFQVDYLKHGQNPFLSADQVADGQAIRAWTARLLDGYLQTFFSTEFQTLMFPDTTRHIYDHKVVKALLSLFDVTEHPRLAQLRVYHADGVTALQATTLWDLLITKDLSLLPLVPTQYGLLPKSEFRNLPQLANYGYLGIDAFVVPYLDFHIDDKKGHKHLLSNLLPTVPPRYRDISALPQTHLTEDDLLAIPDTPRLYTDQYRYIFDHRFYRALVTPPQEPLPSLLEQLVYLHLTQQPVPITSLLRLAKKALLWTYLDMYYYIPVILILLKSVHYRR